MKKRTKPGDKKPTTRVAVFQPEFPEDLQFWIESDRRVALRLGRYFGTSGRFWLNLQAHYDLDLAEDALEGRLEKEVKVLVRAA